MGLYSSVVNSCKKLGPDFLGYMQTKDFGLLMDEYWIAPDGTLFRIDWPIRFSQSSAARRLSGAVVPCLFTGCITLTKFVAGKFLRCVVFFDEGRLLNGFPLTDLAFMVYD